MANIFKLSLQLVFLCIVVTVISSAQDKINVTGEWIFQVETSAGSGSPTFTFKQEGEKLSGKYSGQLGEADIKGTVKGDKIEFSFEASAGVVTYSGTIEKDSMKGKVSLGEYSGTWTAKRK